LTDLISIWLNIRKQKQAFHILPRARLSGKENVERHCRVAIKDHGHRSQTHHH
jgi:hypothetical protein